MDKTISIRWAVCLAVFSLFTSVYPQQLPPNPQPVPLAEPCPVPGVGIPNLGEGVPKITNMPILPGQGAGDPGRGDADIPVRPELGRPIPAQIQNEFQLFIGRSTGQALPMFGRKLFQGEGGFTPAGNIPVMADYLVGPGDELLVRAWGQVDINLRLIVDRNGAINVPKVGVLQVAGLKANQLEGFIKAQVGRVFKNFEMNVAFGRLHSIKVLVVGHAQRPGNYTVSSMSSLLSTLFAAGGPSSVGSMRRIELRRNNEVITELDLYDLLLKGENAKDRSLLNGDIIRVFPLGPLVALTGSVQLPGIYELKGEETVEDILEAAGGLTATAFSAQLTMERITTNALRKVVELKLDDQGRKTKVQNGDLIQVLPISARFDRVVTLNGHVAAPRRSPWKVGMRISELIPDTSYLIPRQFWQRKNNLAEGGGGLSPIGLTRGLLQEINWEYATITRLNKKTLKNDLIVFNLGAAIKENALDQNHLLNPGDVVTIYNKRDIRVPRKKQVVLVSIEGEVERPGVYSIKSGETLATLVKKVGGFTSDAYPYAAVFTRESIRQSEQKKKDAIIRRLESSFLGETARLQAVSTSGDETTQVQDQVQFRRSRLQKMKEAPVLGRLSLEIDLNAATQNDLPNIVLEDGDSLVIPAKQKAVFVIGEVYNSNTLTHYDKFTLNDYLSKAGGATRLADEKRIYVVKANGVVMARNESWWKRSSFGGKLLNPGDAIVVPEDLEPTTFKKELKDWAEIASNFALGMAALKVLGE